MPVEHYENFPVASFLLPRRLREPVEAIYAFARSADDIADEGDALPAARLAALDAYRQQLQVIAAGDTPTEPMFRRLSLAVRAHNLPIPLLSDLLDAFSQDVVKTRYADFDELLDYTRRSANPVGRLMLHLYGHTSAQDLAQSDAICSSLQLINFWQDVAIDWHKPRIYLPQDSLQRFGVAESHIGAGKVDDAWRKLMRFEVQRARSMMLTGAPLALRLPGRIGWELRLVVQGGLRILNRLEAVNYDMFSRRPQLKTLDWLAVLHGALSMRHTP